MRFRPSPSLALLLVCSTLAAASPAFAACPPQGTGPTPRSRALNLLKNRTVAPTAKEIDHSITLATMVAPGKDRSRFSLSQGAIIEGYVDAVYVGGVESANCDAVSPANRDTHIEISLDPQHALPTERVIVEVTPRWRHMVAAQGKDWSTAALATALMHHRIRVTGWMMFDYDHASESLNTKTPGKQIWRATAWEVHPVTDLQILAPRAPGPAL